MKGVNGTYRTEVSFAFCTSETSSSLSFNPSASFAMGKATVEIDAEEEAPDGKRSAPIGAL